MDNGGPVRDAAARVDAREAGAVIGDTLDLLPVGVAHFAADGRFLLINETFCRLLGCKRDQLLEKTFQEVTFPDDLADCMRLHAQLAEGRVPRYHHEKRFVRADGAVVWTRVTVTAARDPEGTVRFFVGVAEDVSAERIAEEARRTAEERLRLALRAADVGVFRWDLARDVLEADEMLCQLFALTPDESTSTRAFLSRIHPEDRPRVEEAAARSAEGGELDEEFRVVWPDGEIRWVRDRARTYLGDDGKPSYVTGACADVTTRRQLDEQLRAAVTRSDHAVSARDEAIAILAHDLRNPLNNIVLATADLPAGASLDDAARERRFAIIQRSAVAMDRLINDLLDIARIDAGTFAVNKSSLDPRVLLEETIELFTAPATRARVDLECSVEDGLSRVVGDHERLRQALSNLVGNALKFTSAGGRVRLSAARASDAVVFAVEDAGCGIPHEQLAHVFDRFWKVDRKSRNGAGLGLAIVKGVVEAHGGQLSIDSVVSRGTKVVFTLPLAS